MSRLLEFRGIEASMRVASRVVDLLVSLFTGAMGLLGLASVLYLDYLFAESWYVQLEPLTFPSTPGVITRNTGKWCDRDLEYDYSVGGVAFHGSGLRRDNIRFIQTTPDDDDRVRAYPVGKRVAVYYKPGNPEVSTLEPGLTRQHVLVGMPAFAGINAMVLGPVILAYRHRSRSRARG